MGRLVITHSTYIEGLIPRLRSLAKEQGIKTVTPGIMFKSKGKSIGLTIRISKTIDKGFKLIAKKGTMGQEIFVVSYLDKDQFLNKLKEHFN